MIQQILQTLYTIQSKACFDIGPRWQQDTFPGNLIGLNRFDLRASLLHHVQVNVYYSLCVESPGHTAMHPLVVPSARRAITPRLYLVCRPLSHEPTTVAFHCKPTPCRKSTMQLPQLTANTFVQYKPTNRTLDGSASNADHVLAFNAD